MLQFVKKVFFVFCLFHFTFEVEIIAIQGIKSVMLFLKVTLHFIPND